MWKYSQNLTSSPENKKAIGEKYEKGEKSERQGSQYFFHLIWDSKMIYFHDFYWYSFKEKG